MEENELYEPQEQINNTIPVTVSKGPFYGLVLAIIGILFIISSFFIKPPKLDMVGTVTYASTLKQSGKITYQQIKISFNYNSKAYETECKVTNQRYSKHDTVEFRIIGGDPTKITTDPGSSGKYIVLFFGLIFLVCGILLFLKIIPYEPIEAFVEKLSGSIGGSVAKVRTMETKERKTTRSSSTLSSIGGFLDKLPKKDNDRTEDDMEERIKRRKEQGKTKKKTNSIYTSDNILDLYEDEEDED